VQRLTGCGVLVGVAANIALTLRPIDRPDETLTWRLSRDLDEVFAEVVSCFEAAVFTTALRMSGRTDDAEDLAAETFLRAYSALRKYEPARIEELQLRPWLITICLNAWRNHLRTATRRPVPDTRTVVPEQIATGESPEDAAQRNDSASQLAVFLQRLPDRQRTAVVLRHVIGLPYGEVALVLRCPEGTAKSHVSRGLTQLRALMSADPEVLR
jgi:RNA polymerase sigma factor (sigma-70 family)